MKRTAKRLKVKEQQGTELTREEVNAQIRKMSRADRVEILKELQVMTEKDSNAVVEKLLIVVPQELWLQVWSYLIPIREGEINKSCRAFSAFGCVCKEWKEFYGDIFVEIFRRFPYLTPEKHVTSLMFWKSVNVAYPVKSFTYSDKFAYLLPHLTSLERLEYNATKFFNFSSLPHLTRLTFLKNPTRKTFSGPPLMNIQSLKCIRHGYSHKFGGLLANQPNLTKLTTDIEGVDEVTQLRSLTLYTMSCQNLSLVKLTNLTKLSVHEPHSDLKIEAPSNLHSLKISEDRQNRNIYEGLTSVTNLEIQFSKYYGSVQNDSWTTLSNLTQLSCEAGIHTELSKFLDFYRNSQNFES